jgi:hypothetical protein
MIFPSASRHQVIAVASFLALIASLDLALGQPHSWADNVCNESVPVSKDIL